MYLWTICLNPVNGCKIPVAAYDTGSVALGSVHYDYQELPGYAIQSYGTRAMKAMQDDDDYNNNSTIKTIRNLLLAHAFAHAHSAQGAVTVSPYSTKPPKPPCSSEHHLRSSSLVAPWPQQASQSSYNFVIQLLYVILVKPMAMHQNPLAQYVINTRCELTREEKNDLYWNKGNAHLDEEIRDACEWWPFPYHARPGNSMLPFESTG